MIAMDIFGILNSLYWRLVGLFGILTLELFLVFGYIDPLFPLYWRTVAEKATLLHSLYVVFSVALGQFNFKAITNSLREKLELAERVLASECKNVQTALANKLEPYNTNTKRAAKLKHRIENLVLRKIKEKDLEYSKAYDRFTSKA